MFYPFRDIFRVIFVEIQEYYETLLTFIDENKPIEEIEMESREVAKKWENSPGEYNESQVRKTQKNIKYENTGGDKHSSCIVVPIP